MKEYPHRIGEFRDVPPLDMDLSCTTYVPAGVVSIAVEDRVISIEGIRRNYAGSSEAVRARIEMELAKLEKTNDAGGISIHVCEAESRQEFLRFDPFENEPHYHYIFGDRSHIRVQIDDNAVGSPIEWVLKTVTERIPQMLAAAGEGSLAEKVDLASVRAAMPRVRELVDRRD